MVLENDGPLDWKDKVFFVGLGLVAIVLGAAIGISNREQTTPTKTTLEEYPLYQNDASIQLPVMFALNHDLVSESTDKYGYCLSVSNRDVECYTMNGRFLGVGSVKLYSDGNLSEVHVIDKAPEQYRRVMTNAFLRVWG